MIKHANFGSAHATDHSQSFHAHKFPLKLLSHSTSQETITASAVAMSLPPLRQSKAVPRAHPSSFPMRYSFPKSVHDVRIYDAFRLDSSFINHHSTSKHVSPVRPSLATSLSGLLLPPTPHSTISMQASASTSIAVRIQ